MKHMFIVVREEKTNYMGDVVSKKIQRGCVYNPIKGESIQDVTIKSFNFEGKTWIRNILGIIGMMAEVNDPCKIFCNKKFAQVGRLMERVIPIVILNKEPEDDLDEELLKNAIKNGITKKIIAEMQTSDNKLDNFTKLIALSVIGMDITEGFAEDELLDIAHYVAEGYRFDNIYYIADGYDRLKDPSTKQFWMNINMIKSAMTKDIDVQDKNSYKNVAPIKVVYTE